MIWGGDIKNQDSLYPVGVILSVELKLFEKRSDRNVHGRFVGGQIVKAPRVHINGTMFAVLLGYLFNQIINHQI